MTEKTVRNAVNALSGEQRMDPVKFFDENKDDPEFILFLQKMFGYVREVEEEARQLAVKDLGEDLGWAFMDRYDKAYIKADKRLLEGVTWADDDQEFKENVKKLLKKIMRD